MTINMKNILVVGPTASGKSGFAKAVQSRAGGTIVNADSCQVYQDVPILSAQPQLKDLKQTPHALYTFIPPDHSYSVGQYLDDVHTLENTKPLTPLTFVGGTGLYLSALTKGLDVGPSSAEIRNKAHQDAKQLGHDVIHQRLQKAAPNFSVHPNNHQRLLRAYEIYLAEKQETAPPETQPKPPPLTEVYVVLLNPPADALRQKIKSRLGQMMEEGALDEIEALKRKYPNLGTSAQKIIGVKELSDYLDGKGTLADAQERIYIRTCQYAKRQRTWFRHKIAVDKVIDTAWDLADVKEVVQKITCP
ncbi:MAG: tRNA (adenosine(37)-N6)-dimethylallyltransferase MiaA [Alphaproteobacteria bacterium]|nr:MAG: tRNA (adenosine(37)-N6)-dimethylallyltransferase MiaA [Alphaproteobacteria bacterium]